MPERVMRSEARSDALDRYAAAAANVEASPTGPRLAYSSRTVAASSRDADRMPITMGPQVKLDGIVGPRSDPVIEDPDLRRRAAERRAIAGLGDDIVEEASSETTEPLPAAPDSEEIVQTVASLVPSATVNRGETMNRIAISMIANLVSSLDISSDRKRWLISRVEDGIGDADIFLRDLRLSMRR